MKKLMVLVASIGILVAGCVGVNTKFQNTAGKFLASTATTVDGVMVGWTTYAAAGKATPSEEAAVKEYYVKYQTAMQIATNSYVLAIKLMDPSLFAPASNNLVQAKSGIVSATLPANSVK